MDNVVLFPANKSVEQGDIIKCIVDSNNSPGKGKLGYCYDEAWFDLKRSYWQAQHLYITGEDPISVGDWCMFYNSPSKVLEINGETAKIESITIVSKSDADFINSIKKKIVVKAGDFSTMIHSFSIKNLPKIIASTDKTLNLIPLPANFLKVYVYGYNHNNFIKRVEIRRIYNVEKKEPEWLIEVNPIEKEINPKIKRERSKEPNSIIEYHTGDGKWQVLKKYYVRGWRDLALEKLNRKTEIFPMMKDHKYRAIDNESK